jgi:hypothetical protein
MEQAAITSRLRDDLRIHVLETVHDVLVREKALSPRPFRDLVQEHDRGNLCFSLSNDRIIGWALCLPRGQLAQELAGAYIVPDQRGSTVIRQMMEDVLMRRPYTFCVVSDRKLVRYLRCYWRFEECGPVRLLRLAGISVLRDRIRLSRLKYGGSYVRMMKPRLLLFQRGRAIRISRT